MQLQYWAEVLWANFPLREGVSCTMLLQAAVQPLLNASRDEQLTASLVVFLQKPHRYISETLL